MSGNFEIEHVLMYVTDRGLSAIHIFKIRWRISPREGKCNKWSLQLARINRGASPDDV